MIWIHRSQKTCRNHWTRQLGTKKPKNGTHHGNPQPSFLDVITHILGVLNLHSSWFWGPRAYAPWDWIIYLHEWLFLMVKHVNVGMYIPHMDHLGYIRTTWVGTSKTKNYSTWTNFLETWLHRQSIPCEFGSALVLSSREWGGHRLKIFASLPEKPSGSNKSYQNPIAWKWQNLSKSQKITFNSKRFEKPIKILEKITLKSTCWSNPLPVVRTRHFKTSNTPYIRIPGKTLRGDFFKGYFSPPLLVPWFPGPGARLLSKKKTLWEPQKTAKTIWAVIIST